MKRSKFSKIPQRSYFKIIIYFYVWIYENGVKRFYSYYPYFTLIPLEAASKPCKMAKNRERTAFINGHRLEI